MRLDRAIPALTWLRDYRSDDLGGDALAAVIVTIMLIPQSLAYALLAGLPPQVGLYASILPLVAYALFGSSRTLSVGPVAVVSLMTAAAIGTVAGTGVDPLAAALVLALLSGLFLIALGLLRLGFLANVLSHPVISGFITASALLIAASQLRHILGIDAEGQTLVALVPSLTAGLDGINAPTALVGIAAMAFLFWVRRGLKPALMRAGLGPRLADGLAKAGPVVAIAATTAAVAVFDLEARGVAVVGAVPPGLPSVAMPAFDARLWLDLLPAAILIGIVGFVESISVAQSLAAKRRQRIDANQELIGLGAANVAASVTGGYPVTGGFARSIVNFDAGARTPLAGVMTAVGIAATAVVLTPAFAGLPKATLAATIIVAVLALVDGDIIVRTWRYAKSDAAALFVTMATVLAVGVEAGIVAGVLLSVLLFLWRTSRPHMAVVGQVPGTEHFRNVDRHAVVTSAKVLSVRIDESLYFANGRYLEDRVYDLAAARPALTDVVLMGSAINLIDASALESLESLGRRLKDAGVRLHLSEIKGPVMDRLKRSDFLDHMTGQVFLSHHDAMVALDPATVTKAYPQGPSAAGIPPQADRRAAPDNRAASSTSRSTAAGSVSKAVTSRTTPSCQR
ncbi:MAG: SulP family inorganic anion transporter [Inquilinaceae bacterium]